MADLETDGLYPVTWDSCDGCDCSSLLGSPQDAQGRGILLTITRDGAAVDLSDSKYKLYFLWLHRQQHVRGCVAMEAVDAAAGRFSVFFPAAMIAHEGEAVCSVVLSWDDKTIATPTFSVRIDESLVSTLSIEDGFTLFAEALKAYEAGTEDLLSLVADLTAMRDSGEFDGKDGADGAAGPQGPKGDTGVAGPAGTDGKDGADGKDGVSCTHSWDGTVLTVTSASGTSSADLVGPKGEKGEAGATGASGAKGDAFTYADFTAEQLASLKGPKGDKGETGATGADGTSCTHSWDGTVLTVTSASGTSSADLVGPQGPKGDTGETGATGPQGPAGADGTTFTPAAPLSLSDGTLSVDLTAYVAAADLPSRIWVGDGLPSVMRPGSGSKPLSGSGLAGAVEAGDWLLNPLQGTLCRVTSVSSTNVGYEAVLDWAALQGVTETTMDLSAGETGRGSVQAWHALRKGALLLNPSTGSLMRVTTGGDVSSSGYVGVDAEGLGNVLASGTTFEAASPLSLADGTLSIDLSSYATQAWVKSYMAETFPDLSGVSY